MCEFSNESVNHGLRKMSVYEAVGTVLAHDITEIRPGEFKGRAFKKGHVIKREDICHLQRLGKENLYILELKDDEMHEDDAAYEIANALRGEGVELGGEPKEGKINLVASRDGLLKVNKEVLLALNMLGDVMCATLHSNTAVRKGRVIAGMRAIPLVVNKKIVEEAVSIADGVGNVLEVKEMKKPKAGVVITGNEVFYGRIKDAFAPIIKRKMTHFGGEVIGVYYAPDDISCIERRLRELMRIGADLLITTGGMSVDPDDVTRFAIRNIGAEEVTYGSAVLPGAMMLVAYLRGGDSPIPVLGVPACGLYHEATIFDLILPRILAGESIGRKELAELGHGGLCLHCKECRYPECPFGK